MKGTPPLSCESHFVSSLASGAFALRARYVFPVAQPPLADGVVTIADGRIVAVGENVSGRPVHDLGQVALLPGLVNAHTHLEFSDLPQPIGWPGLPFPEWIRQVVVHRRGAAAMDDGREERRRATVVGGLEESLRHGTTAVGEIATGPWPAASSPWRPWATVFLELLGLSAERTASLLQAARDHVAARPAAGQGWRPGLSPHAPYTVRLDLLAEVCRLSADRSLPVAMHLAESAEELELLRSGSGSFVGLLQDLNAWDPNAIPPGRRPGDYLELLATAHRALVIHGNYLTPGEIDFVAARRDRMSVVYCPRTHAYFQHPDYPLAAMLAAGVKVALGTDSRASNPDLDVLAEWRYVCEHHSQVAPADSLRMATQNGALALGLGDAAGTLTVGKRADLTVVALRDYAAHDPHELLLDPQAAIVQTYVAGEPVWAITD